MTMRSLWRQESWPSRAILVVAVLLGVLSVVDLLLEIVTGFFGVWHLSGMLDNFSSLVFAVVAFESVYWRRRALNAEKPLPPTMVIHEYPTLGVANIARHVENVRRAERETAG